MLFELHVWGPAFGLPSIDPECTAAISFCQNVVERGQWALVLDHETSNSTTGDLPALFDNGIKTASGFEDVVNYIYKHPSTNTSLGEELSSRQQVDKIALITFFQSHATPIMDLLLYVSTDNYNSTTSPAYTAILPWYASYTVRQRRRDLARARTAHMGLNGLEIDSTTREAFAPGRGTAASEYEAAKRSAGIPAQQHPATLNFGPNNGLRGFLGGSLRAARIQLDALTNEFLTPLSDLLGEKTYLLQGEHPSSLDHLAFGYLALLFYPNVPQPWVRQSIQSKYPRIVAYIDRLHWVLFQDQDFDPAEVWATSVSETRRGKLPYLPWRPTPIIGVSNMLAGAQEFIVNIPGISSIRRTPIIDPVGALRPNGQIYSDLPSPLVISGLLAVSTVLAAGLATFAVLQRHLPREGDVIFWAMKSTNGLGEAGNILSVLAGQLPR